MGKAAKLQAGVVLLGLVASLPCESEAASCRGYARDIRAAIKNQVAALRALEREAADRLQGLDTRPFDYLVGQARTAAGAITEKDAPSEAERLARCRDAVPPERRACAAAAQALVGLIEGEAMGVAATASKGIYAQAMPQCERSLDLTPLTTVFRTRD